MRKFVFLLLSLVTLTLSSCNKKRDLFPVYGEVYCNGAPAEGAVVSFHRKGSETSNNPALFGIVQEDGSFELEYSAIDKFAKGAPPGDYIVTIEWKPIVGHVLGRSRRGPDKFKGRYADPKHALLEATVESKRNNLDAFELKELKD